MDIFKNMGQIGLFENLPQEQPKEEVINLNNGHYLFVPNFFNRLESDSFFQSLRNSVQWRQESMRMYGKEIMFPRLTAWYGDVDKEYKFSGITLQPHPWTEDILNIKLRVEQKTNIRFNSVLLNLYRNGNDSISWHTDAEPELGKNPAIASVNFGQTRKFQLRHIKSRETHEINLTHGSLLVMLGELQHFWQHQVPKSSSAMNERINLTFRVIK